MGVGWSSHQRNGIFRISQFQNGRLSVVQLNLDSEAKKFRAARRDFLAVIWGKTYWVAHCSPGPGGDKNRTTIGALCTLYSSSDPWIGIDFSTSNGTTHLSSALDLTSYIPRIVLKIIIILYGEVKVPIHIDIYV